MKPARAVLVLALTTASGCEYLGAIGVLADEYRSEENEKSERLEQCGECPAGRRCNLLMDPGECRPDPGSVGDRCGSWRDREDPEHSFGCAPGLHCNAALDPPTCAAPGGRDHACHLSEQCEAELYCDTSAWVCRPTFAVGAPCTSPEECRPLTCHRSRGGVCAPASGLGEACATGTDCADEFGCSDRGECIDPLAR
ncbi:hypothetical protein ACNOYE_34250 [Nannocystaceae bacterium ST9]